MVELEEVEHLLDVAEVGDRLVVVSDVLSVDVVGAVDPAHDVYCCSLVAEGAEVFFLYDGVYESEESFYSHDVIM